MRCGNLPTSDGHDACIANLGAVVNACCGHGIDEGYIQFDDGVIIRGNFKVERNAEFGKLYEAEENITERVLGFIMNERLRQNDKWGDQSGNHPFEWMSILMEEVGELAEAVNETCFQSEHAKPERGGREAILIEAIHVAAVATAIAESVSADMLLNQ